MKNLIIKIITLYQKYLSFDNGLLKILAPGGACRYYPTCSEYTKESILAFGVMKGSWKGFKRIISCNPLTA